MYVPDKTMLLSSSITNSGDDAVLLLRLFSSQIHQRHKRNEPISIVKDTGNIISSHRKYRPLYLQNSQSPFCVVKIF